MKNYTSFGARSSRVSGNQSFDEDARRIDPDPDDIFVVLFAMIFYSPYLSFVEKM